MKKYYEENKDIDDKAPVPREVPDDVIKRMATMIAKPTLLEGYFVPNKTPLQSRYDAIKKILQEKYKDPIELEPLLSLISVELKKNPSISQTSLAKLIGRNINTVKYHIKKMREWGIIDREGSSQKGSWIVKI
jgi:ATP-dependent DNA helicase RecG